MTRGRRRDGDGSDDRRDRGQVILIGAVALAFIVLGVVVVFNGVLYTETLSSGGTGQSASDIDTTELEVEQGIGCLLSRTNSTVTELDENDDDSELDTFAQRYGNATANADPTVIGVSATDDGDDEVELTYDSNDATFTQTLEITSEDCPRSPSIESFDVEDNEGNYTVNWTVHSSSSDLFTVNVTFVDSSGSNRTTVSGKTASGSSELEGESGNVVKIMVQNEAGYVAAKTESN